MAWSAIQLKKAKQRKERWGLGGQEKKREWTKFEKAVVGNIGAGGGGGLNKIAEIRTPLPTMIEKCCLISLNVELIELFLLLTFVNLYVFLGIPINLNFLSWVVA